MDLSNKVAVVTGSGQGLGLAYAKDLARHGAAVVINDVNQETAGKAVASIRELGGRAVAVVAPVGPTEPRSCLLPPRSANSADSTSWSPTPASFATPCCGR